MKNKSKKLSTQPYKGARDFYPDDMRIRNWLFDIWKRIPKRYGYEEYDNPIIESFDVFASKTGEEIVNQQLYSFEDKGGRKIAIRPELTPSTVRMIANKYNELTQPIRWFMIGNNWRFEKPQLGRGREFYQLEVNIFGVKDVIADFEIFEIIIALMLEFKAKENMFTLLYSDRKLVSALLDEYLKLPFELQTKTRRIMDKFTKLDVKTFSDMLIAEDLKTAQIKPIIDFLESDLNTITKVLPEEIIKNNQGYKDIIALTKLLTDNGLIKYCKFAPSIIRGFDYSDGLVYEVFDNNPKNSRSIFGGERFDGLINIFGDYNLPATGFAMGDYTPVEFLKNWDLIPEFDTETKVYVTVFDENSKKQAFDFASKLREKGVNTLCELEARKLDKQLKFADKKGIPYAIIIGPEEIDKNVVVLKDMRAKTQETLTFDQVIIRLAG